MACQHQYFFPILAASVAMVPSLCPLWYSLSASSSASPLLWMWTQTSWQGSWLISRMHKSQHTCCRYLGKFLMAWGGGLLKEEEEEEGVTPDCPGLPEAPGQKEKTFRPWQADSVVVKSLGLPSSLSTLQPCATEHP